MQPLVFSSLLAARKLRVALVACLFGCTALSETNICIKLTAGLILFFPNLPFLTYDFIVYCNKALQIHLVMKRAFKK